VRDLLHVDELADLVDRQLAAMDRCDGETFNVGGGNSSSLSLQETTRLCEEITGRAIPIHGSVDNRPADVKVYISDNARVANALGWTPVRAPRETLVSIYEWLRCAEPLVRHLWGG
jgi:CDP-paratose 2-epimerase